MAKESEFDFGEGADEDFSVRGEEEFEVGEGVE